MLGRLLYTTLAAPGPTRCVNHISYLSLLLQGQMRNQRQQHLLKCSMHSATATPAVLSWQRDRQKQVVRCRQPLQPRYGAAHPGQPVFRWCPRMLSLLLCIPFECQCGLHSALRPLSRTHVPPAASKAWRSCNSSSAICGSSLGSAAGDVRGAPRPQPACSPASRPPRRAPGC
jgi:hypothetical protein